MIIVKKKRWWHALVAPSAGNHETSWAPQRKCKRTLTTSVAEHVCEKVGEHWDHECVGADCKFKWAA